MNQKFKTVLFDIMDLFECEIEEVIEYYYEGLTKWAVIKYRGNTSMYAIPLYCLGVKRVPLFGVVQ